MFPNRFLRSKTLSQAWRLPAA